MDRLLEYPSQGYVLVSGSGVNGVIADRLCKEGYRVMEINEQAFRAEENN